MIRVRVAHPEPRHAHCQGWEGVVLQRRKRKGGVRETQVGFPRQGRGWFVDAELDEV